MKILQIVVASLACTTALGMAAQAEKSAEVIERTARIMCQFKAPQKRTACIAAKRGQLRGDYARYMNRNQRTADRQHTKEIGK